jgi:hypothetical protein
MGILSAFIKRYLVPRTPPLEYVRSRELSIFSLFYIDPVDAAVIISALEAIDSELTGFVNIKAFTTSYCVNTKYVFNVIWTEYISILKKHANESVAEKLGLEFANHKIDILPFLCFILFFMSINETEMSEFSFFLFFSGHVSTDGKHGGHKHDHDVNPDRLKRLISKLGKSRVPSEKNALSERLKLFKAKVDPQIDSRTFKRVQFHSLDVNCRGPYSRPLIYLQRELKKNFASKAVWDRIQSCIAVVRLDWKSAISRMVERRYVDRVEHFKNTGDRKRARKELAPFVKIFQDFAVYMRDDDDTSNQTRPRGFLSSLVGLFASRQEKISPEDEKTVVVVATAVNTNDMEAMTHIYRKQLRWTMDKVFDHTDTNRQAAEIELALCDEEVLSADDIIRQHLGETESHYTEPSKENDVDDFDEFGEDDFPVEGNEHNENDDLEMSREEFELVEGNGNENVVVDDEEKQLLLGEEIQKPSDISSEERDQPS